MALIAPSLPVVGNPRGTEELKEITALTTIRDAVNGGLDTSNFDASPFAPLVFAWEQQGTLTSALPAAQYVFGARAQALDPASNAPRVPGLFLPSTNPWLLTGRTPKLRVSTFLATNGVDTGLNDSIVDSITVRLRAVTPGGTGGNMTLTLGTVVFSQLYPGGSSVLKAGGSQNFISNDIDMPAAGLYTLTVTASKALAANSVVAVVMRVGVHYV